MRCDELYVSLAREALTTHLKDDDVLLFMILLHTHEIHLQPGVLLDDVACDGIHPLVLAPLTQNQPANVAASLRPADATRNRNHHWYSRFGEFDPHAIPADRQERFGQLLARLRLDPRIAAVEEEM